MMKMRPSLRAGDAGWGRGGRFEWCQQRRQSWSCKHNSINLWTGPTNHRSMGISRALWQGQNQLRRGGTSRCPQIECPHSSQGQKATGILMGKKVFKFFQCVSHLTSLHTHKKHDPTLIQGPKMLCCWGRRRWGWQVCRVLHCKQTKEKKRSKQCSRSDQHI